MTAQWIKPSGSKLADALALAAAQIQAVIPQLLDAQAQALKRMADLVVLTHPKSEAAHE